MPVRATTIAFLACTLTTLVLFATLLLVPSKVVAIATLISGFAALSLSLLVALQDLAVARLNAAHDRA